MNNTQPECKGCQHQNRCEDVYRRLGASKSSPVLGPICLAFVVPMALLVLMLVCSEWMLGHAVGPTLASLIGVVLAGFVILFYAVTIRWFLRRIAKL